MTAKLENPLPLKEFLLNRLLWAAHPFIPKKAVQSRLDVESVQNGVDVVNR